MSDPFVLGVNYWPRRKAMYWWSDFDAGEVRDEFALIHELGLSVVRIFLLWEDFQPAPDTVDTGRLEDLRTVADIAAEQNLGLDVTFFTGHMSGPNWSPGWLLDSRLPTPTDQPRQVVSGGRIVAGGYRNMYTDASARFAARTLLRSVVGALKDHPAIWLWNLGNEPDLFALPPDAAAGRAWVREMAGLIRDIDPGHPVTCGLHSASLHVDCGFRIDQVYAETDWAVMHAYPMYVGWARQPLDPALVPFTCALTSALCGKPTLMEEFGGCTNGPGQPSATWEWETDAGPRRQFMASEEEFAAYIAAVLPGLVEVGATGAMIWCFADYAPELWDRPPCADFHHERFFGLVRPDGTLKPHAWVLRDFARARPAINPDPPRRVHLDITPDEYYAAPLEHLVRLYAKFLEGEG